MITEYGVRLNYTFIDGTNNRFAIDNQCSQERKTYLVQSLYDAQRLARNALEWSQNETDVMDMYMGPNTQQNKSFVDFTTGAFEKTVYDAQFTKISRVRSL